MDWIDESNAFASGVSGGINTLMGRNPEQLKRSAMMQQQQEQSMRDGEVVRILSDPNMTKQQKRQAILQIPDIVRHKMEGAVKSEYDELYRQDTNKSSTAESLRDEKGKWERFKETVTDDASIKLADQNLARLEKKIGEMVRPGELNEEGYKFTPENAAAKDAMSIQENNQPQGPPIEAMRLPAIGTPEFKREMESLPQEKRIPTPEVISTYTKEAVDQLGPNATAEQIARLAKKLAAKYGWIIK